MKIATVVYTNPVQQWLWESGAAYWLYGGLCLLVSVPFITIGVLNFLEWRRKKKKK